MWYKVGTQGFVDSIEKELERKSNILVDQFQSNIIEPKKILKDGTQIVQFFSDSTFLMNFNVMIA